MGNSVILKIIMYPGFLFFLIFFVLLIPTIYAAVIGAPPAPTHKSRIKQIIKIAKIQPSDKFYELGSGTGRVMIEVARKTGAEVIGFELSPIFYFITLFNLKLHGIKRFKLFFGNFLRADFKKADVVFCFLMPNTMDRLRKKFKQELRPGTRIISYIFEIKNWIPYAVIKDNKKPPVYFYKIETTRRT